MIVDDLYECGVCNSLVEWVHFDKTDHLPRLGGWVIPKKHHCGYKANTPLKWKIHLMNCNEPTKLQKLFGWLK